VPATKCMERRHDALVLVPAAREALGEAERGGHPVDPLHEGGRSTARPRALDGAVLALGSDTAALWGSPMRTVRSATSPAIEASATSSWAAHLVRSAIRPATVVPLAVTARSRTDGGGELVLGMRSDWYGSSAVRAAWRSLGFTSGDAWCWSVASGRALLMSCLSRCSAASVSRSHWSTPVPGVCSDQRSISRAASSRVACSPGSEAPRSARAARWASVAGGRRRVPNVCVHARPGDTAPGSRAPTPSAASAPTNDDPLLCGPHRCRRMADAETVALARLGNGVVMGCLGAARHRGVRPLTSGGVRTHHQGNLGSHPWALCTVIA